MSGNPGTNNDEVRISSKDLEYLLRAGNFDFEKLDFMPIDPSVAKQIQQFSQTQSAASNVITRPSKPMPGHSTSRQPSRGTKAQEPWIEIVEQPLARGVRFRDEYEGRSARCIRGETSTPERKTFPSIKIHNYNGPAVIVVSCVTKDEPYKPHPHNLVGKDCKKGVCTIRIRDTTTVSFPYLGIRCAKKKDVEGNLKMRQNINVDPFQTGFKHRSQNIELNVVRLCFQVFLPDDQGRITRIVPPVVSQTIHDKRLKLRTQDRIQVWLAQILLADEVLSYTSHSPTLRNNDALNPLVICRVNRTNGRACGGDEVFLICEKFNKDDIRIRFYEERDGHIVWENFGDFGRSDVHKQFAIVFKTPPYHEVCPTHPVQVQMQIQRLSDLECSDSTPFMYMPYDPDPDRFLERRKRKAAFINFLSTPDPDNKKGKSECQMS